VSADRIASTTVPTSLDSSGRSRSGCGPVASTPSRVPARSSPASTHRDYENPAVLPHLSSQAPLAGAHRFHVEAIHLRNVCRVLSNAWFVVNYQILFFDSSPSESPSHHPSNFGSNSSRSTLIHRQQKRKLAPPTGSLSTQDFSPVRLKSAASHRQPQTHSRGVAIRPAQNPRKISWVMFRWNSRASIRHGKPPRCSGAAGETVLLSWSGELSATRLSQKEIRPCVQRHRAASRSVLQRVIRKFAAACCTFW